MNEDEEAVSFNRKIAERALNTQDIKSICDALLSISLYEKDWKWAQDICLTYLESESSDVRGLAATCLGHIARIHSRLEKEKVIIALRDLLDDKAIEGQVESALSDIDFFVARS